MLEITGNLYSLHDYKNIAISFYTVLRGQWVSAALRD